MGITARPGHVFTGTARLPCARATPDTPPFVPIYSPRQQANAKERRAVPDISAQSPPSLLLSRRGASLRREYGRNAATTAVREKRGDGGREGERP
ncbi:hypothetical protein NDU88_004404 [Pleurodeles waltl]|uniref:Uncharacterized protein n=1 Tax=Pleurodeles waltl TaxID=8319 RepID=A0AAV7QI87_PLEWA|nr:hypothetical protein NDU88_004404 [Pleurodeles waltl]